MATENGCGELEEESGKESEVSAAEDMTGLDSVIDRENEEETFEYPEEVKFLTRPEYMADMDDARDRKIANVRRNSVITDLKDEEKTRTRCDCVRTVLDVIVNSYAVQILVMLVILFDFILTIISFTDEKADEHPAYDVCDWLTVIVLSFDVLGRCFVIGKAFFRSCMNLFELFLVPVTIVEIFILSNLNIPIQLLRTLRPIFRAFRMVRLLLRAASGGERYLIHLRHQVSGDRVRFIQDGFDLDLAYITNQLVVMPFPAVGRDSWLHNPAKDVARFFNERHPNKYLILNLTNERKYPLARFFHRYMEFPIDKDGVPTMEGLMHLCDVLNAWLKGDPRHILAVHSRNGQGRSSLVTMALLLHEGTLRTPASAIAFFEYNRCDPKTRASVSVQSCDCASQRRFLEYFARMCHERRNPGLGGLSRQVRLKQVQISGLPGMASVDIALFNHPHGQRRVCHVGKDELAVPADDDNDDDGRSNDRGKIAERVQRAIDDATFDAYRAGGQPASGEPIFCSMTKSDKLKSKSLAYQQESGLSPGIWDLEDIEFSGAFKLEIVRRKLSNEEKKEEEAKNAPKSPSSASRSRMALVKSDEKSGNFFDGGLMLSCWLHTAFLEQDESKVEGTARKAASKSKTLIVSLDRFQMDKAADAPTLKSHSPALRLKLTFEIEERRELALLKEVDEARPEGLYSAVEMSQPETMQWFTFVGSKIWPNFEKGFEKMMEDNLITTLKETLPGPLNKVSLAEFSLGDSTPQFGPIVASSRNHNGKEVQLNIGLSYVTDTRVIIDLGIAALAINKLSLKGTLCLKFKPILNELPVLCAMQLFFLNAPSINIRFGRALEMANWSVVRDRMFGAINDALGNVLVLPNVMNINWGDPDAVSDSAVTFMNVLPCAVLRVNVEAARGLKADSSIFRRAPDSYVRVSLGTQQDETTMIKENSDPIWQQQFDFIVYDERQHVKFVVYDIDLYGNSNIIGQLEAVSVADICNGSAKGVWEPLQDTPDKVESKLQFRAELLDLQPNSRKLRDFISRPPATGEVMVRVETDVSRQTSSDDIASVAMLVCEVFGGKVASKDHSASSLEVQVCVGEAKEAKACEQVEEPEAGGAADKTHKSIYKLAEMKMSTETISDILQESPEDVANVLRRGGWNLACKQKIKMLLKATDLEGVQEVVVELRVQKGARLGKASVTMAALLEEDTVSKRMELAVKDDHGMTVAELEVDVKMLVLQQMKAKILEERSTEASKREETAEPVVDRDGETSRL
eukprot:gb/GFBE01059122.1/.p1 GENE.gb/GFBE01059122.1/~~gb/GFBE01059122.1/.p1  ORF type:complete len:1257 (+),score=289.16 gb/GFBE01059122.1/:1-3771(+)